MISDDDDDDCTKVVLAKAVMLFELALAADLESIMTTTVQAEIKVMISKKSIKRIQWFLAMTSPEAEFDSAAFDDDDDEHGKTLDKSTVK